MQIVDAEPSNMNLAANMVINDGWVAFSGGEKFETELLGMVVDHLRKKKPGISLRYNRVEVEERGSVYILYDDTKYSEQQVVPKVRFLDAQNPLS